MGGEAAKGASEGVTAGHDADCINCQLGTFIHFFFHVPTLKGVHTICFLGPKIWPQLICRGKNFGGGFLGTFKVWESEYELRFAQKKAIHRQLINY
jgi:hypothetical protein